MSQLYIISAPSGAGKSSLISALIKADVNLQLSISHTTRQPREGEKNGQHYHFTSKADFIEMINNNQFLEHANVFGNYYGTTEQSIRRQLGQGVDCILEIDWQGAKQVRNIFSSVKTIFILPPSISELQNRLEKRGQDSSEVIQRRMQSAKAEMS